MPKSAAIVEKATAQALSAKCKEAIAKILAEEGFEVSKIKTNFGDVFGFHIEAIPSVKNELGINPNSAEAIAFNQMHTLFNLPKEALGRDFTLGPATYKLVGLAPGRSKYPIAVEKEGQKMFLTDTPGVIGAIARAAAEASVKTAPPAEGASTPRKPRSKAGA